MINNLFDISYLNNVNNSNKDEYNTPLDDKKSVNPSILQGYNFTQYQNKIKENFTTNEDIYNENEDIQHDYNVNSNKYNNTIKNYSNITRDFKHKSSDYSQRISNKNKYSNKIIRFSTGELYYVTNNGVAKLIPTPNILNSISEQNGCPKNISSNIININIPWKNNYRVVGTQIPIKPPLVIGTNMKRNESCGYEGSNVFVNSMLSSDPVPKYVGCYKDNKVIPTMKALNGNYNFEQCEDAAILGGYQYFSLNNVNKSSNTGTCLVSNNKNTITSNGISYDFVEVWSSNTKGKPATYAVLSNDGTLSVRDKDSKIYFSTLKDIDCATYTYNEIPNTTKIGNDISFEINTTLDTCKTICNKNSKCSGFAYNTNTKNMCWTKTGNLSDTKHNKDRALYKKTADTSKCIFFLSLQEDGNMCIYRGKPENTGNYLLWSTQTNGKQNQNNTNYVSTKGKYGLPLLKTDQVLNAGDWISSKSGNLVLKMENNGNLVLYTFKISCTNELDNKNYYGQNLANALYDIGSAGIQNNMGKLAYIDADSQLHNYPEKNIAYSNTYSTVFENSNISGNNIPNTVVSNVNDVEDCMDICNDTKDCNAFVYDTTGPIPICLPKKLTGKDIYSPNNYRPTPGKSTYLRDKEVKRPPIGIDNTVNNIDSVRYNNYGNQGGPFQQNYDLAKLIVDHNKKLTNVHNKLNFLSSDMSADVNNLDELNKNLIHYKREGFKGLAPEDIPKQFLQPSLEIKKNKKRIAKLSKHDKQIDTILKDSNIKTLQQNYSYMLWTILALGTLLITMKIKNS